ncbi:MAG: AAA family ATPase [Phascolarctobacterium sp.]|nr:AAA family ATPase [Phascolarctobacterium sp.]
MKSYESKLTAKENPFSLTFGKEPFSFIDQYKQNTEIIDSFLSPNPAYQVCMLTGVRGSGKTVSLTTISNEFKKHKDWIVIELNQERKLLESLTSELCDKEKLSNIFQNTKVSISALGFEIEVNKQAPFTDVVTILDKLLNKLTENKKKLLITIDEVSSNQNIKEFVAQFQIFLRKNYNVFLLMTGLYENIYELENEKTLTFLYRAPKIEMQPLNLSLIMHNYQKIFNLADDEALKMAKITQGYPFAYQVLGYLCFKNNATYDQVIHEFDAYLEDFVYEKIWVGLSEQDRKVLIAMAQTINTKVEDIRDVLGMASSNFSIYRKRLLKKGIVVATSYGHLEFTLPRFKEFIERNM